MLGPVGSWSLVTGNGCCGSCRARLELVLRSTEIGELSPVLPPGLNVVGTERVYWPPAAINKYYNIKKIQTTGSSSVDLI